MEVRHVPVDSATLIPKIDDVRKLIDRLVYSSAKCRGHEEAHIQVSAICGGHKKAQRHVSAKCWGHQEELGT